MLEPTQTLLQESTGGHVVTPAAAPRQLTPRIDSQRLLVGGRELVIQHGAEEYRLRLTRNDKLILTK